MRIELRSVAECPNLDRARTLLHDCLDRIGLRVEVSELVGDYPSPSIIITNRN